MFDQEYVNQFAELCPVPVTFRVAVAEVNQVRVATAHLPESPHTSDPIYPRAAITVDLLFRNAGIGSLGAFRASDREHKLGIVELNFPALGSRSG